MPKKNFKQVADDNPALAFLGTQPSAVQDVQHKDDRPVVHDGQDRPVVHNGQDRPVVHNGQDRPVVHYGQDRPVVHNGQDISNRQPTTDKAKCHINLRVSQELKDYLTDASWRERKSITQYLTDLIEADRKKTGERNV